MKKYFAKHITINGIDLSNTDLVPAFLPGYSESYCIDGIHENLNNYDTTFVITDMRLVKNWLKRNHKNTSIQIKDLMSSDLICDDAAHVSLSEISLPNTQKFDKVYCSVNGITQDATPGQPDELTVIGEKGSIIFICWISLNGNFKNFKTDMVLRNKWKQKAISLLDLVTFVK